MDFYQRPKFSPGQSVWIPTLELHGRHRIERCVLAEQMTGGWMIQRQPGLARIYAFDWEICRTRRAAERYVAVHVLAVADG